MFRQGKIVDSGNKSSRSDRFAEMSKQQQLIENKKQEIQAKYEEMKRKATDDASKKLDNSNSTKSKDTKSLMSRRLQSWKKWVFFNSPVRTSIVRLTVSDFFHTAMIVGGRNKAIPKRRNLRQLTTTCSRTMVRFWKSTNEWLAVQKVIFLVRDLPRPFDCVL